MKKEKEDQRRPQGMNTKELNPHPCPYQDDCTLPKEPWELLEELGMELVQVFVSILAWSYQSGNPHLGKTHCRPGEEISEKTASA